LSTDGDALSHTIPPSLGLVVSELCQEKISRTFWQCEKLEEKRGNMSREDNDVIKKLKKIT
jgi:hypothetical protein